MVDHLWRTDRAPASICPYLKRGVRFAVPSRIGKHVNITGAILKVDRRSRVYHWRLRSIHECDRRHHRMRGMLQTAASVLAQARKTEAG
jgi:hypothetical protein